MNLNKLIPWHWNDTPAVAPERRETEQPVLALQRSMNRLFEDFFTGFELEPFAGLGRPGFHPALNVAETKTAVEVTAELPGLEENDIQLELADDLLTISGEKKSEREEKSDGGFYRMERSFGSFRRQVPLPAEIVPDKANAVFKNGVLTVHLPKKPEAQTNRKKIAVRRED